MAEPTPITDAGLTALEERIRICQDSGFENIPMYTETAASLVHRLRTSEADAERRVRAAVLEEAAAHFDALAADIGAFATDRVATIIRALKESPHVG